MEPRCKAGRHNSTVHQRPSSIRGTITYNGFYGDHNIGDQSGDSNLSMLKGTSQYGLNLAAPPMWSLWNPANSGTWSTSSNWSTGGVANAAGQTAYFGTPLPRE